MISLGTPRKPSRIGLTPMVDVVFLLLVFFMLAARFDTELGVPLSQPGFGSDYPGAPRLVDVFEDRVTLNGSPVSLVDLADALRALMPSDDAVILLRPRDGANVQRVVELLGFLDGAGLANVILGEGE